MEIPSDATAALLNLGTFFCILDRLSYWLALGAITVIRRLPRGRRRALGDPAPLPPRRKGKSFDRTCELTPAQIRSLTFRHFITIGARKRGLQLFRAE
jgi:hypothetical protein